MKKLNKLLLLVFSLMLVTLDIRAAGEYDGKALDNPVCDSGYSNSFEGATYYDMAVPYALTLEDIGGYATTGGDKVMASNTRKEYLGDHWNIDQAKYDGSANYLYKHTCSNISFSYKNGMSLATDTNGNEYYLLALPKYFFNNGSVDWGTGNRGVVCELYFTDGKYIRVLIADAKAVGHTNGGEGDEHKGTNQDAGHNYKFSTLNYKQYQNTYQAYAGETFEWFSGSGTSFANVPAIAGSSGHVAFVRIYNNLNLYDGSPTLASGESKEVIGQKSSSGCNVGSSEQSEANVEQGYVGGYYSEMELSAWLHLQEADIQSLYLDGAVRDSLSQAELEGLSNWERNIKNDKMEDGLIAKLRIVTMFFGIILIVWSVLMYLAYWFDRINTFFDLDLLGILTLGKLHMSDTEDECTYRAKNLGKTDKKTVNHRAICTICILGIGFGALVVSGVIYKLLATMINTVLRLLGVV